MGNDGTIATVAGLPCEDGGSAPSTAEFVTWATHLLTLTSEQCHPALFANRERLSRELLTASASPHHTQNQAILAGVKFLCYSRP